MYLDYFSLRAKPFQLLPDPGFLFPSVAHKRALAYLEYGLREQSGFILLTGEVGAGKTTLIRSLLRKDLERTTIAKIFNTKGSVEELIRMILDDFGLETQTRTKAEMLRELNAFLIEQYAARRRSVLIVDEAQNLDPALLEEVRLLSNLEVDDAKLLHIILVGQPELRSRLHSPELIQLRQRILVHCHIPPLTLKETEDYVLHRLDMAGNRAALDWQEGSLAAVHAASRGVPRLVNILCDYILLDAFQAERREVSAQQVREILQQLEFENQFWPEESPAAAPPADRNPEHPVMLRAQTEILHLAVASLAGKIRSLEKSRAQACDLSPVMARLNLMEQHLSQLQHDVRQLRKAFAVRLDGAATRQRTPAVETELSGRLRPDTAATPDPKASA